MQTCTIQIADLDPGGRSESDGPADGPAAGLAAGLAARIEQELRAHFQGRRPVQILRGPASSIDEAACAKLDAVVLVIEREGLAAAVNEFSAELEDQGIAVSAIVAPEVADAVLPRLTGIDVAVAGHDPLATYSRLEGMLHRQPEVTRLAQELAIARRYQGGVSGEMNRIHEELQLAAVMQRDLLPRTLPERHGIRLAGIWRPCGYVSGDIYAAVPLGDDSIGIFLADSVGHGVPAALMTMILSRSFEMHARRPDGSPTPANEVLAQINADMVRRQSGSSRFATAIYAVVNCRTREMELCAAGHPPAILYPPGGAPPIEVDAGGPLLGVFDGVEYESATVALPADSTVILYSDGFEQAFPEGGDVRQDRVATLDRYRDYFNAAASLDDPHAIVAHLDQALDEAAGSLHQADDVTMLCLHAAPLGAAAAEPAPEVKSAA
ncbi:MAG: PP2C family protein-serine/threonine phosphatase [Phycisphaerales bacterium]